MKADGGSCETTLEQLESGTQGGPLNNNSNSSAILKLTNCLLLRNHQIFKDDIWIQAGKIIDPEKLFYNSQILPDRVIDCGGALVSPGFIDVQLNGMFFLLSLPKLM